jgi:MFS transporter, OFA family, oxalate/formate antiporter
LLYVAKGVASLLVPLSSIVGASASGWNTVFFIAAMMNFVAALLAVFVLRPLRAGVQRA